jgi:putative transposase
MAGYDDIRTDRHHVFHLVFDTGHRHRVLAFQHLARMEKVIRDACAEVSCMLAEFNREAEHMHLLVNFPPTVAISRLVSSLKGLILRAPEARIPGTALPLLAGQAAVVRVLLRRVRRRRSHHGPAPAH